MLPAREQLTMTLGADLISFNHFDYVRHFLGRVHAVLGLESAPSRLEYLGDCCVRVDLPGGHRSQTLCCGTSQSRTRSKTKSDGPRVVLSLDALDASKGIPQRLLALEALLDRKPEWRGEPCSCCAVEMEVGASTRLSDERSTRW